MVEEAQLKLSQEELKLCYRALRNVPIIEVKYFICPIDNQGNTFEGKLEENGEARIKIRIERKNSDYPLDVEIMRFPKAKIASYFVIVGIPDLDKIVSIQRVSVKNRLSVLEFDIILPPILDHQLSLDIASDSYLGIDYSIPINLIKANQVLKDMK